MNEMKPAEEIMQDDYCQISPTLAEGYERACRPHFEQT